MPKCANVVILVILTNILTLTIYSTVKYENLPNFSAFPGIEPGTSATKLAPLPQPNQLSNSMPSIQTGRVIQSFKDDTSLTTMKSKTLDSTELMFENRRELIKNACIDMRKSHREPFVNDPSHLFILQDRAIAWCPVFKAGSSTWLSTILELSSKSQVRSLYNI